MTTKANNESVDSDAIVKSVAQAADNLCKLNDLQLIMLALSAIVLEIESMPAGIRLPLHVVLKKQAERGIKTEILRA